MQLWELFIIAVGLSMDAFAVATSTAIAHPAFRKRYAVKMGLWFGAFQFAMPLLGWLCVRTIAQTFTAFQKLIPWIALALLCFIGGKMLLDGIRNKEEECGAGAVTFSALLVQGVATSIDALSVGFTIAEYGWLMALVCALIIAAVTFAICMGGLMIGRKFGTKLAGKASILGGVILILIGIEIFLTGIL